MEMKSFASDKDGPGGETSAPRKIARKSTAALKKKESKYDAKRDDPMSFEIYEVVGNLQEHLRAAGYTTPDEIPDVKGNNFVIGDEVLLSLTQAKDPLNRTPQQKFVDLARMIQAEKAKKYMPYLGKKPTPYATIPTNKMIIRDAPSSSVGSTNAGVGVDKQSNDPGVEDCGYMNFQGNEETVTDSCPSPKKADDNDKETEKKPADGLNSMEEVPEEGVAEAKIDGMVKASGSDTGMKNGSSAPEEKEEKNTANKEQEDKKDILGRATDKVPDEVPEEGPGKVPIKVKSEAAEQIPGNKILQSGEIDLMNQVEEVVVSSGFAWNNDNQRSEYFNITGRFDDDEDDEDGGLIGEVKIKNIDSVEFMKHFPGDTFPTGGHVVEIRAGNFLNRTGNEEMRPLRPGEIPVSGEIIIRERSKRKRIPKSEDIDKLSPKKRKVEKSKIDSDGFGDGKDKGKSHGDKGPKKDSAKPGSSICDQSTLEETIDRVASGHLSLPFIENLKGEIKSLSRADLEELIVQKLCEVITERSAVGHLRKRAEALEKDQERWKEKVLSLTKQIKEMDMVMKNYLSEVRRHHSEKSFQMVAPLRVTRSVGLQVSFTATPSKLAKTVAKCSGDAHHAREKGGKHSNRSVHVSQTPSKPIPILPSTSSTKPLVIDSKNKFSTKSGLTITLQPASSSTEAQLASKPIPIQPKLSILPATDSLSSSLIDLTGDHDRQAEDRNPITTQQTLTVGPPGQVKVVNHIQPAQSSVGAVTLLISNATSPPCCSTITSTTTSESQNRQLAIPGSSTQRHILPAIPTLIYKPNTLIQPGSQVMTSQARSSPAKTAKHPAPLPPPPANQIHKPNWKLLPPRPALKISKGDTGIVLSWNMPLGPEYETIVSYQLFAYQESDSPPSSSMWKRVGEIKALRLPMACTLTQFLTGHKYYFAVRGVDIHSRVGPFSLPSSIALIP